MSCSFCGMGDRWPSQLKECKKMKSVEVKTKLAALEAARLKRQEEREQAEEEPKMLHRVSALETLASAEEKHGAKVVRMVETSSGEVVVKIPHEAIMNRFSDLDDPKTSDFDTLVMGSLVFPGAEKFT